jgi:hypothetical protein
VVPLLLAGLHLGHLWARYPCMRQSMRSTGRIDHRATRVPTPAHPGTAAAAAAQTSVIAYHRPRHHANLLSTINLKHSSLTEMCMRYRLVRQGCSRTFGPAALCCCRLPFVALCAEHQRTGSVIYAASCNGCLPELLLGGLLGLEAV